MWRTGLQSAHSYHAVYVNKVEKQQGKPGYLLHCLNSWGDANNPNPVIKNKDIVSLHYVSLFMENYIVLSSTGPAAEYQGARLGIYQEKGVYTSESPPCCPPRVATSPSQPQERRPASRPRVSECTSPLPGTARAGGCSSTPAGRGTSWCHLVAVPGMSWTIWRILMILPLQ